MTVGFHPELASKARFAPRGFLRSWNRRAIQSVITLGAKRQFTDAEEVQLGASSVFVYRPKGLATPAPALLWIHGGGLVIGDARMDADFLTDVADELGMVVASAQYRLAPDHPYPAPLDDCVEAVRWLAEQADVDGDRIVVGGASAGGGLAAATCQRLADDSAAGGGPSPAAQLLVYPMLDDRSGGGSGPDDHLFRLWTRATNEFGWDSYLAGQPRTAPAVPARRDDLSGLPPAWIGVGTADLFHDEDVAYAERLGAAGVAVELEVVEGAYHGFDVFDAKADVSKAFRRAQIDWLATHIAASGNTTL